MHLVAADPNGNDNESQRLLLICREAGKRPMLRSLRALQPIETRALDAGPLHYPTLSGVVLVAGLPVDEAGTFRRLRIALKPFLDRQIPVLWLLDAPSARDEVQARALGADMTLARSSPASLVRSAVAGLPGRIAALRTQRAATRQNLLREVDMRLSGLLATAAGGDDRTALVATASSLMRSAIAEPEVEFWLNTMAVVHEPTYRHCMLMAGIAAAFAPSVGFDQETCFILVRAALLHDIGKTLVPVEILNKPEPLTAAEMAAVREHPQLGFEMLQAQGDHDPVLLLIVRHHHELLDGSGYPSGLQDHQIDQKVRIATLCDIFAALIEERTYKSGFTAAKAMNTMAAMHGKLDQELLALLKHLFVPTRPFGRVDAEASSGG